MRSVHKAQRLRQDAALELVLEHHRGSEILAASGGDAEHALRIIDELKHRAPSAQVIRLPREPILDYRDVLDEDEGLVDERRLDAGAGVLLALGVGLAAWAIIAAIAYGVLRLVEALT